MVKIVTWLHCFGPMQPLPKNKNKVRFHLWNDSQPCSDYSNETHFFIAYFFYANGIIKYTWMCAVIFSFLFLHSAPNIANTCIAFVLSWWWLWSFVVFWQSKGGFIGTFSLLISLSFTFQSSKLKYSSSSKFFETRTAAQMVDLIIC